MDVKEAAAALNNSQYRNEGSRELFQRMKEAGLVAVYGASDDLMEFEGAIRDEIGAWEGSTTYVTKDGLLVNECEDDDCPHFKRLKAKSAVIEALWCEEGDYSWTYRTAIPHETFEVLEDDDKYCRGIVFSLYDLGAA
mgnify:CR=1 FL=1